MGIADIIDPSSQNTPLYTSANAFPAQTGETLFMDNPTSIIPVTDIILDHEIYPRSAIDHRRVSLFAENLRDGFSFDPIHVEDHPEEKGKY